MMNFLSFDATLFILIDTLKIFFYSFLIMGSLVSDKLGYAIFVEKEVELILILIACFINKFFII